MLTLVGLVAAIGAVLLIVGPEKVFNQLHIWVFPDDHQWFFYYQDSLMSTMMFAPHLFGWIGLAWTILIVFIFTGTAVALNSYSAKLKSNRSD